jgi:LCP family protein required for cell wall assembly
VSGTPCGGRAVTRHITTTMEQAGDEHRRLGTLSTRYGSPKAVEAIVRKIWWVLLLVGSLSLVAHSGLAPVEASLAAGSPSASPPWVGSTMPTSASLPDGVTHIILLGTDRRPPAEGWRTDTMILVSIDPDDKLVSMVSIPRDLYVAIPGYGKTRLNLADNIGEAEHYAGGGPGLLKATLEENLGLTFDRYVRIDFQGFGEVVDILGGIDVDVRCPTELWVPNMKDPGEYLLYRTIPAGMLHMDGDLALIYCRCRAHTPVFDRDRRQREVLLAIRNRVLELGVSGLLPRLFELLETMDLHVQTDLEAGEIVALAQLLTQIPLHNFSQSMIDLSLAPEWTTSEGAWVMLPDRQLIKQSMAERLVPSTWEEETLAAEGTRIAVDNGTSIEGFASQIADRLVASGYHVVEVGKDDRFDHVETSIISYVGTNSTLERLQEYFGVSADNVHYQPDWLSGVSIRVILGTDAQPLCP